MKENFVSFSYKVVRLPKPTPAKKVLRTLILAAESGQGILPSGWLVEWSWRNTPNGALRTAPFETVVAQSRAQFLLLMGKRLRRDLANMGYRPPPKPKIRRVEPDEFEEEEEE